MANSQIENQVLDVVKKLQALDMSPIRNNIPNLNPWNNLGVEDYLNSFDDLIESISRFHEDGFLSENPWNILNSLYTMLNAAFAHSQNFLNSKNQQHFQSAFQHIENARTNLQTWGMSFLFLSGNELEKTSRIIDEEVQRAMAHTREIDALKKSVNELIEPAVAGSLSKSFANRKTELIKIRRVWFWSAVVVALFSILATWWVVTSIVSIFGDTEFLKALAENASGSSILWSSVLIRLAILLPVYSMFGLVFSQYRKERTLEEEYAHREAVATSLPNYANLAVDSLVKDQILSEASKVVFMSPVKAGKEKEMNVSQLSQLIDNLNKLTPKRSV